MNQTVLDRDRPNYHPVLAYLPREPGRGVRPTAFVAERIPTPPLLLQGYAVMVPLMQQISFWHTCAFTKYSSQIEDRREQALPRHANEYRPSERILQMVRDGIAASAEISLMTSGKPASEDEIDVLEDAPDEAIRAFVLLKFYRTMSVLMQRMRHLGIEKARISDAYRFLAPFEMLLRDKIPVLPRAFPEFSVTLWSELSSNLVLRGPIKIGIGQLARDAGGIMLELDEAVPPMAEVRPARKRSSVTFG